MLSNEIVPASLFRNPHFETPLYVWVLQLHAHFQATLPSFSLFRRKFVPRHVYPLLGVERFPHIATVIFIGYYSRKIPMKTTSGICFNYIVAARYYVVFGVIFV
jgi:hypothetical protein